MSEIAQYFVDAVAFGSLFALMALGLALLFSVMGLMNFAYGELIMIGGYTMYYTRDHGWVVMVLVTLAVVVIASLLMELLAFRPVRRGTAITLLITSFAVSYGLQQLAWMTVGRGPQKGVKPFPALTKQFEIGGVLISGLTILTIAATIVILVGMTLLLRRTVLGIQLRAASEDFQVAQLMGVKANRVISAAFAITGILAGTVALLYVLRTGAVAPDMGQGPLLVAFVGGAIGGLGSLVGAAIGGFVLGAIINSLQATLPVELASHTQMFAFLLVIAILVIAPDGLVGLYQRIRGWVRRRRLQRELELAPTEASPR
jgi:branched-chain amino acid transport system permease protein